MKHLDENQHMRRTKFRLVLNNISKIIFMLAAFFGLFFLAVLLGKVFTDGIGSINMNFLTGKLSTQPERAGIMGAILGTFWLMLVVAPVTMFLGVGTAIYLEMYAKKGRVLDFIQTNISNLAGVPSIVYGILGMTVFVRAMNLGNVVLAGGLAMSLLILPIVIVASQEAIRSIPFFLSEAAYGLGATKWQTIQRVILPAALPGILTGAILALSRAIGETAPLVVIGIPALLIPFPGGIMDRFTVLPMQIYYWTLDASLVAEYANLAAATIIVLLVALFILNSTAIIIRNKFQRVF
ncbi:phosphate ABC transporter permease PstA [Sporosarcina sp. ACRSL]|uniref:phosphate ABC transporter permease PstA n=1 Tax=Sporosarcina sp. ACRSL TaxID=2918215 RepID=UPI001EF5C1E7|nr:phosphate ABC transporter permease PstA [Sporosarcina sp. ACRSL]MCG7343248.1 phosphate ABC transporter permease PstA [Sporosarcina sp. ACRSL]